MLTSLALIVVLIIVALLLYPMYLDQQGKAWEAIGVAQYTYPAAAVLAVILVACFLLSF